MYSLNIFQEYTTRLTTMLFTIDVLKLFFPFQWHFFIFWPTSSPTPPCYPPYSLAITLYSYESMF